MYLRVTEILEELALQDDKNYKEIILEKYKDNHAMNEFFLLYYDKDVKWFCDKVPDYGIDKLTEKHPSMSESNLSMVLKKMYIFKEGEPSVVNLSEEKKKNLLIDHLESLSGDEAELLSSLIEKTLKIPGITKKMVSKILWDKK